MYGPMPAGRVGLTESYVDGGLAAVDVPALSRVIAGRLGTAVSTVSREVAANGGRGCYRAWRAHRRPQGLQAGPAGAGCPGHVLADGLVVTGADLAPVSTATD
jgi:hypothetical protein